MNTYSSSAEGLACTVGYEAVHAYSCSAGLRPAKSAGGIEGKGGKVTGPVGLLSMYAIYMHTYPSSYDPHSPTVWLAPCPRTDGSYDVICHSPSLWALTVPEQA